MITDMKYALNGYRCKRRRNKVARKEYDYMKLMILSHNDESNKNTETWDDILKIHEEESDELIVAIKAGDKSSIEEETMDQLQVCLGILDKLEREGANLEELFNRHNRKLIKRFWKDKGEIKIQWEKNA